MCAMSSYKFILTCIIVLMLCSNIDAKRKKHKSSSPIETQLSKTKTKWSSSSEMGADGGQLATEEHGYYVKRTFLPTSTKNGSAANALRSPPYLAIPIVWFSCNGVPCTQGNTGVINGAGNALQDGFLCDDDCDGPYAPICGRTPSELAVFYNKCKLNVAKCRTHGLWLEFQECERVYPNEVAYADRKFRASPYFRENVTASVVLVEGSAIESHVDAPISVMDIAMDAVDKIDADVAAMEAAGATALEKLDTTTAKKELSNETVIPSADKNDKPQQQLKTLKRSA